MAEGARRRALVGNRIERLVVMLRYADELTFEEIAAVLERSVEEVKQIHGRIVERARRPRSAK